MLCNAAAVLLHELSIGTQKSIQDWPGKHRTLCYWTSQFEGLLRGVPNLGAHLGKKVLGDQRAIRILHEEHA